MKITAVEVFPTRAPLRRPRGPSILTYSERTSLFVKIATEDGLVGWGETYLLGGADRLVRDVLGPLLIGRDPRDVRGLHRQLASASFYNGFALGCVDIALHDLWGKALGVPIHRLYGGALRERVPVYASLAGYDDERDLEDLWIDETTALAQRGVRAIKLRIGRYPPAREIAALARVRESLPDSVRLMVDANAAYSLSTAIRVGAALAELGITWFEEPLPQHGHYGYPELRHKLGLPLAGGEGLQTRAEFSSLLGRGAVDIVQPDVSICGGIGECLFVAELAELSAVQCIPHCWAGAVTLAATVHVVSVLPDGSRLPGAEPPMLELDMTENPFRDELSHGTFDARDGCVDVPRQPGLGIDLDESVLRRYLAH